MSSCSSEIHTEAAIAAAAAATGTMAAVTGITAPVTDSHAAVTDTTAAAIGTAAASATKAAAATWRTDSTAMAASKAGNAAGGRRVHQVTVLPLRQAQQALALLLLAAPGR